MIWPIWPCLAGTSGKSGTCHICSRKTHEHNSFFIFFAGNYLFTIFSWNIDGHCDTIVPFLAGQLTGPSSILGENHRCDGCDFIRVLYSVSKRYRCERRDFAACQTYIYIYYEDIHGIDWNMSHLIFPMFPILSKSLSLQECPAGVPGRIGRCIPLTIWPPCCAPAVPGSRSAMNMGMSWVKKRDHHGLHGIFKPLKETTWSNEWYTPKVVV